VSTPISQDQIDRRINDFASRSFRDMADRDYIAARLACRAQLMPQFLWSAQQAIEKYCKYILLVNRIKATAVRHDIKRALDLTKKASFNIDLSMPSREFIGHVADYGEYRYLDVSYAVHGYALVDLDRAVWDLRRYCQVLDVFGKALPAAEQRMLEAAHEQLRRSRSRPPHEFRLPSGYLERVLKSKQHPARAALIWNNAFFGERKRKSVRARHYLAGENAPLYLFPHMLDQLLEYVYVPKVLADAYRLHLADVEAGRATP
jgi:HEPN domain-containing protein